MHTEESNLGLVERTVSTMAGGALVILGLRLGGVWRFALPVAGAELMRRGVSGKCFVCEKLGKHPVGWRRDDERIDAMSMESFPASDAPAY